MIDKLAEAPVIGYLIPKDPILTVERDESGKPLRYSLDADSENVLQRQRMFAMVVGGPAVVYAGWKMDAPWWQRIGVMGLGIACTTHHFYSWKVVSEAKKQ
jgi:hypothetical protein